MKFLNQRSVRPGRTQYFRGLLSLLTFFAGPKESSDNSRLLLALLYFISVTTVVIMLLRHILAFNSTEYNATSCSISIVRDNVAKEGEKTNFIFTNSTRKCSAADNNKQNGG